MSDKTDLTAAIALIRSAGGPRTDGVYVPKQNAVEAASELAFWEAVSLILGAVVSGDLVPAARRPTVAGGNGSAVRGR